MASKRSLCDKNLIRHGLLVRCWPLMAVYFAAMVFVHVLPVLEQMDSLRNSMMGDGYNPYYVFTYLGSGTLMSALMGLAAALATFGFVNGSRSVNFYHALPMRRETLFASQFIVGMTLIVIPVAAITLTVLAVMGLGGVLTAGMLGVIGTWCGKALIAGFVFYSIAILCAMICGNSLAMIVVYLVLNAFAPVMGGATFMLARFSVFGLSTMDSRLLNWCCPFLYIAYTQTLAQLWPYLLVGVAALFGALALYRKRHVENAGEIIAVPFLRPLFKYGFAVCFAVLLTLVLLFMLNMQNWSDNYNPDFLLPSALGLTIFGALGLLIAQMLLAKSYHVFKSVWKGALALAGCVVALVVIVAADLTGFVRWVPAQEEVLFVHVGTRSNYGGYWYTNAGQRLVSYAFGGNGVNSASNDGYSVLGLTNPIALDARENAEGLAALPETIDKALLAHQEILRDGRAAMKDPANGYYTYARITFTYQMRNGNVHERSYAVPYGDALLALQNTPELVAKRYLYQRMDTAAARGGALYLSGHEYYTQAALEELSQNPGIGTSISFDRDEAQILLSAVLADMREGNVGNYLCSQDQLLSEDVLVAVLNLDYRPDNPYLHQYIDARGTQKPVWAQMHIPLSEKAVHTLAALRDAGVPEEFLVTYAQLKERGYDTDWFGIWNNASKDLYLEPAMYE